MWTAALLFASLWAQSPVDEFFPLQPGTRWHYVDENRGMKQNIVNEVGEPGEIEGKPAARVRILIQGKVVDTVFYRTEGDTAFIVGYSGGAPLDPPRPELRVGSGRLTWEWEGLDDRVPLKITAEAQARGTRKVLDRNAEVIEVKMTAHVGGGEGAMRIRQTAYYARGIGLYELIEERQADRGTNRRVMKLVKFEPPPIQ
jgi:hypothetical protein